jgi:hypothetical protein
MFGRKMTRIAIAVAALSAVSGQLATRAVAAPLPTAGLVALSLQGVGSGSTGGPQCAAIPCSGSDVCECLAANYTLVGNQGFAKGTMTIDLSVDTSIQVFPISNIDGGFCAPATGTGTIQNTKGNTTIVVNISGFDCPTLNNGPDVFSGTYVVTDGTGKFSSASGGTGAINGSQFVPGGLGQVAITGSLQPVAPVVPTPTPSPTPVEPSPSPSVVAPSPTPGPTPS